MFASVVSFAQQHSVNGTVKDQNGQPVIGLTVLEQGTKNGVITMLTAVMISQCHHQKQSWSSHHWDIPL